MPTAALESASGAAVLAPPAFKASVNSPHSVGNISWVGRHRQSSFRPLGERLTLPSSVNLSHAGLPKGHRVAERRRRFGTPAQLVRQHGPGVHGQGRRCRGFVLESPTEWVGSFRGGKAEYSGVGAKDGIRGNGPWENRPRFPEHL